MDNENEIINQTAKNEGNKLDNENPLIKGAEDSNEAEISARADEILKTQYLRQVGIDIIDPWQLTELTYPQVIKYQEETKNKIIEVQNNLPPKDLEASRLIFEEALKKLDIVKTPDDLKHLKREDKNKSLEQMDAEIKTLTAAHDKIIKDNPDHQYPGSNHSFITAARKKKKR